MRNAGLEEAQAGIKTARRNIDNLSPVVTAEFSKFAGILSAGGERDDRG